MYSIGIISVFYIIGLILSIIKRNKIVGSNKLIAFFALMNLSAAVGMSTFYFFNRLNDGSFIWMDLQAISLSTIIMSITVSSYIIEAISYLMLYRFIKTYLANEKSQNNENDYKETQYGTSEF